MRFKHLILITGCTCLLINSEAQIQIQPYFDVGVNNASEGVFIKNSYRIDYQYGKYNIAAGTQFDLKSNTGNVFTGLNITGSREFLLRSFPFEVKGYWILNRFSDLFYGTDWGVTGSTRKLNHFLFELGTNFKTYTVNHDALKEYGTDKAESKLRENFNLIYVISGYLKPHHHKWNIGLSCTNIDYYIINQSTNPFFNLQMMLHIKSGLTVFLDSWYKKAGVFNISANSFGYSFRTGVTWEIKYSNR
ncbi:MAG TPA: hypothetical protein ENN61_03405 [Bacteroidaceae bacterium]|nr:hypothetical protein [Bacteroidaceae bacterium]